MPVEIIELVEGHFPENLPDFSDAEKMTRNIHVDASVGKPWEILNHCAAYSRAVFQLTKRLHRVEDSYGVGRLCHNVTLTHLEPISLRSESSGHPRTDSHCHSGRASIGRNIVAGVMAIIVMSGKWCGNDVVVFNLLFAAGDSRRQNKSRPDKYSFMSHISILSTILGSE